MKPLLICLILLFTGAVQAELIPGNSVSGFVYDKETGEALIGASVLLSGTTRGTSTNTSGFFALTDLPEGFRTLEVRYIGYRPAKREITAADLDGKKLIFNLSPDQISLKEVVVTADSAGTIRKLFDTPVSQLEITGIEIRKIPQIVEPDLLRSLQTLPGIVPASDFSSQVYVRGGTPDQNLYMVDGTDIYNPEHAFGLFSTFNTDAIKNVVISKGGFGAEYGGRLSSVVDVTNLDGNRNQFTGTANISLLSAKSTVQIPLGRYGSLSGSLRRTYFDKTIGQIESLKEKVPDYYFIDGNLKALIDLNETNKLTVSYFGGRDYLNFKFNPDAEESDRMLFDWGNKTGSLKWLSVLSPTLFANFWLTASQFDSELNFKQVNFTEINKIRDLTVKGNLEYAWSQEHSLRFGFESKFLKPTYLSESSDVYVDIHDTRTHLSGYIQEQYKPAEAWLFEAGLRLDHFSADKTFTDFSPRLVAKYNIDDLQNIKLSAGVYRQYIQRVPRFFIGDIWVTSDRYIPPSRSNHYILGYERVISDGVTLQAEVFFKTYRNLNAYKKFFLADIVSEGRDDQGRTLYTSTRGLFNTGNGTSTGFEALLKKDLGIATGWIGYTYSSTDYTFGGINRGKTFHPRHDRSHTLNGILNTELEKAWAALWGTTPETKNSRWILGVNFVYSTGQPITTPASAYLAGSLPDSGTDGLEEGGGNIGFSLYPGAINSSRLPDYIRADISLTWEKKYETWSMAPYLQIFNAGNRQNVWFITYSDDSRETTQVSPKIEKVSMFPLIPTLGITFNF